MIDHAASAFKLLDKCRVNLETDKAVFTVLRKTYGLCNPKIIVWA
jgi:hypothetical protein